MFCGENKVKRFFSGLTYFLLLGNTEGMVTNYKEMMNGKREIPISSCPSQIEDLVYGTGSVLRSSPEDEAAMFEKTTVEETPVKKGKKTVTNEKAAKIKVLRKECGYDALISYCTVYTDNTFKYDGELYKISNTVEAYAPKKTALGVLYDMDKIICVKCSDGRVCFYTANYDPIDSNLISNFS